MAMERLLRPREVARQLAVSRSTVYRWFWEGKLAGGKLSSGTVRIKGIFRAGEITAKRNELRGGGVLIMVPQKWQLAKAALLILALMMIWGCAWGQIGSGQGEPPKPPTGTQEIDIHLICGSLGAPLVRSVVGKLAAPMGQHLFWKCVGVSASHIAAIDNK